MKQALRIERFWKRMDKNGPTPIHMPHLGPCWVWTGARFQYGYGKVQWAYKFLTAHRITFELVNGPLPDGAWVCHHCNNPACCNPKHIYAGNAKTNAHDALTHGGRAGSPSALTSPARRAA
jgi:hypothetical protein